MIVVDKPARNARDGKLLTFYPATIGSEEKPAPSGNLKVRCVHRNPDFRYDSQLHWKDVKSSRKFTIRPGRGARVLRWTPASL